jgi:hypothetical protein
MYIYIYIYIYIHTFHFPSSFTAELACRVARWTRYSKLRRTVSVPTWRLFHLHQAACVMAVRHPEINRNCLAVVKVDSYCRKNFKIIVCLKIKRTISAIVATVEARDGGNRKIILRRAITWRR